MVTSSVALVNGQQPLDLGTDFSGNVAKNILPLCQSSSDGVTPNSVHTSPELRWYLMRAAYGQEKKAESILEQVDGVEQVYIPQWYQERRLGGKRKKVLVSIIPNTLFVRSTASALHQLVGRNELSYLHHCYEPNKDEKGRLIGSGRKPIVVPDYQMQTFMKWVDADAEDKIYRADSFFFKENDVVRVTEGNFEGFIGHIVRLKGQTRVGINIDGVGFISTTYIPKNCLEKIEVN